MLGAIDARSSSLRLEALRSCSSVNCAPQTRARRVLPLKSSWLCLRTWSNILCLWLTFQRKGEAFAREGMREKTARPDPLQGVAAGRRDGSEHLR